MRLVKPAAGVGYVLTVMEVMTPKVLPPPPRSAHSRSELLLALAVTSEPSATTTSTLTIWSTPSPRCGPSQLCPPPVLHPTTPTVAAWPQATTRPCLSPSDSASPHVSPGASVAVPASSSQSLPFISVVRMSSPSSHECRLRKSWPVAATHTPRLWRAAKATAACTCVAESGHATNAGAHPARGRLRSATMQNMPGFGAVGPKHSSAWSPGSAV
mmetsp:Transcript_22947/g.80083  ORF Transcript_22947/g.80083 Transcript_22947/m.80083 type:complete len:214 (-) Transcript_22947:415-1056(-)